MGGHNLSTDGGWYLFFEWLKRNAVDKRTQGITSPGYGGDDEWKWVQRRIVHPFLIADQDLKPWGPNPKTYYFVIFEVGEFIGFIIGKDDILEE